MDTSHGWSPEKSTSALKRACLTLAALALLAAGCKTDPTNPFFGHASQAGADDRALATEPLEVALLANEGWYERQPASYARRTASELRWRHPSLEAHLHPQAPRANLSESLSSTNPVVAANAAIVAAHQRDGDATDQLAVAVRSTTLPLPLRCAAAEAFGHSVQPAAGATLRRLLGEPDADRPADLHASLLRALSAHAQSDDETLFAAALEHPAWQVRLEGVAALGSLEDAPLPAAAFALAQDRDPRVRAVALRAIASSRDSRAVGYLQQALDDPYDDVRLAARIGLGDVGTADARALLARLKDRGDQLQQAATLATDAARGVRDEVQAAARDTQSQVRLAAAETLDLAEQRARQLGADVIAGAQEAAFQTSIEVQLRAIDALDDLPIEQAGPLLLVAMARGGPVASRAAAEQLARRWPPAAGFSLDASAAQRERALAELRSLWVRQYGQINETVVAATARAQQIIDDAEQLVDQAVAVAENTQARMREVQQVVAQLREANLPDAARQQAAQSLERLAMDADVAVRRRAAQAMGELADPVFLPALMALLSDQPEVQVVTITSLRRVAGGDVTTQADGRPLSTEEQARGWQLWYREQQPSATPPG